MSEQEKSNLERVLEDLQHAEEQFKPLDFQGAAQKLLKYGKSTNPVFSALLETKLSIDYIHRHIAEKEVEIEKLRGELTRLEAEQRKLERQAEEGAEGK